jgi:antitoxin CptB
MEPRRKRILYRATHRGTKEADLIVGGFFRDAVAGLAEARLAEAEALLVELDPDLMDWVFGRKPVPDRWQGTLMDDVIAYGNKVLGKAT